MTVVWLTHGQSPVLSSTPWKISHFSNIVFSVIIINNLDGSLYFVNLINDLFIKCFYVHHKNIQYYECHSKFFEILNTKTRNDETNNIPFFSSILPSFLQFIRKYLPIWQSQIGCQLIKLTSFIYMSSRNLL